MRRRVRTIGQSSDGGDIDLSATLSSYVQTALTDYNAIKTAFAAAQQALDVLNAKTQAQWKTVQAGMETFVQILTTAAGAPWLGALFNAWFSQQPGAAAGPGYCVTDPPSAPDWPTLRSWKHYTDWGTPMASAYGPDAAGSFEAFANPQLEYNRVLMNNCFAGKAQDEATLLAHLVQLWNAAHQGPTRSIVRHNLNPVCNRCGSGWCSDCQEPYPWDPIASALWTTLDEKYPCSGAFCTNPNEPKNATLSFVINDGPEIQQRKVVTLLPPPKHPLAPATAATAATTAHAAAASPTSTALAVTGLGVVAAGGLYVYLKGMPAFVARLVR